MSKFDYLVVGSGLFGAIFAYEAANKGKRVKVIEKRNHIAGKVYRFTNTVLISFIRQIRKFGIM